MKSLYYYNTSIGKIGIAEEKGLITNICYITSKIPANIKIKETETTKEAYKQISEYLNKKRFDFDLPINPNGDKEIQKILIQLMYIPYGEIITYKDLGLHFNKHPRAIGTIIHKNPVPILIPCHRVVGSDGKLKGYIGGSDIKRKLLQLEEVDEWYYRKG